MQPNYSSNRILLPVKQGFIVLTLLLALILNMVPGQYIPGVPDWVALTLAFWCVREPLRVGVTTGFVLGIAMDVANAAVMGQHALAYVLLAYGASVLSRRMLWFPLPQQALHILPLILSMQIVTVAVRLLGGGEFPGWGYFLSSLSAAVLWIPLTFMLLLPQYQPEEKDENRPI
jgi:rod shape-determining protein MreD